MKKKRYACTSECTLETKCFIVSFDLIVWIFCIWFHQHPLNWHGLGFFSLWLGSSFRGVYIHLPSFFFATFDFSDYCLPASHQQGILAFDEFVETIGGGPLSASASRSWPSSWCLHRSNRCYAKRRIIWWLLKNERRLCLRDNANGATRLL